MNWIRYAKSGIRANRGGGAGHGARLVVRWRRAAHRAFHHVPQGGPTLATAAYSQALPAAAHLQLAPGLASAIFEHAVDALVVLDGRLAVCALNPSAERLLQWSAEDAVGGLECRQLLACRRDSPWFLSGEAHGECVCQAALRQAVPEAELLIRPRPGHSSLVAVSGTPLPFGYDRGVLLALRPMAHPRRLRRLDLDAGSLRLDVDRHEACVGERRIHLTPLEFSLLRYLLANRERVVSRQELLENVWKYHCDDGSDVVRVHVASLRRALRAADVSGVRIANTYGVGYMLSTQT